MFSFFGTQTEGNYIAVDVNVALFFESDIFFGAAFSINPLPYSLQQRQLSRFCGLLPMNQFSLP